MTTTDSGQSGQLSIKNWAEADRPREKLLMKGAAALTDSELLAILIGSGNDKESAVTLSKRILQNADNDLHKLGKLDVNHFMKNFRGIGTAKAVTIVAAMELGRRRKAATTSERQQISSSQDAYEILYAFFADLPHEEVWALLLDRANKVIAPIHVSKGGVSGSVIDIRLILREAINRYASGIVLAHNHPTGNCKPSPQDISITHKLKEAARWMDIALLDHLIMCEHEFYSFADEGNL